MITEEMYKDVSTIDSLSEEFKEFLQEVYRDGFNHGQNLFRRNIHDIEECEDANEFSDRVLLICWEADDSYRQYSPFEFFYHKLNNTEDPDAAWDAYERGITDGIQQELDDYTKTGE